MLGGLLSLAIRHKVFVSYHHANDQFYRDAFEAMFAGPSGVFISKSVQIGEIANGLSTDYIRQKIRDEYLRDSTVTVVLVGAKTWQRKHVDWEISSSIRSTLLNSRSGLIGIVLPTHPSFYCEQYDPGTVPPRLANNALCGFASMYKWSTNPFEVSQWIHEAYERRSRLTPDNSYPHFVNNKYGERWI